MNRLQIRDLARKKLGETTGAFWTDDEMNTFINDGCRDISFQTKCLKADAYLTTSDCTANATLAGTSEIALTGIDSDIYSITEVYFQDDQGDWEKMTPKSITEMDIDYPDWRSAVGRTYTDTTTGVVTYNFGSDPGLPFIYYWDYELNIFGWYPPSDTTYSASNNIHVYYVQKHSDISSNTDSPTLPEPLHLSVVDYVCATGFETRGQIERANDYWNKYRQRLLTYMAERNRMREDDDIVMRNYRNI